ncbi:DUF1264-domain-containing protein [Periconia macrospinosa]|uniref:DUF1264-domain-containing protein n=1 Tax=Periconia macrospinosa TaxID=97972 RepID=A0A2V1E0G0_9PLEO|nr:DUF1264-domain-containing protein [Periconia macrospinosa]
MDALPVTNKAAGEPESLRNKALETGAAAVQNFAPVERICAHLNAFHAYADDLSRKVEANHYCAHLNDEVRQCILYDSPTLPARIIGIGKDQTFFNFTKSHISKTKKKKPRRSTKTKFRSLKAHSHHTTLTTPSPLPTEYMITPRLFSTLTPSEQKLWHSHVFEVKSGMLIMPQPAAIPDAAWELAENREMEEVIQLYGKVYHLWQTDRGDKLPLGEPKLMMSFTKKEQFPEFEEMVGERDKRFGTSWERKKEVRKGIKVPENVSEGNSDWSWKEKGLA